MNQAIENIGSFIMIISVFLIIALVIIAAFNYSLKKRLIDRGHIDEAARSFLQRPQESKLQSMKWALLFFFGGLGLVVCEFLPYNGSESPLPYGVEAIFIAIGFFIYYLLAKQKPAGS